MSGKWRGATECCTMKELTLGRSGIVILIRVLIIRTDRISSFVSPHSFPQATLRYATAKLTYPTLAVNGAKGERVHPKVTLTNRSGLPPTTLQYSTVQYTWEPK